MEDKKQALIDEAHAAAMDFLRNSVDVNIRGFITGDRRADVIGPNDGNEALNRWKRTVRSIRAVDAYLKEEAFRNAQDLVLDKALAAMERSYGSMRPGDRDAVREALRALPAKPA